MKTVLVFGATGTLGTYFVDALCEEGFQVWAVGRRNIVEGYYQAKGMNCATVDITRKSDFDKLPRRGVDAVVQIAGAMPSRMVGYRPETYFEVNTLGTLNVLEYCRNADIPLHLFMQSHSDVAGYWNTGEVIDPYAPRKMNLKGDHAAYIISKNAAVDLCEHYYHEHGLRSLVFRLPTVYSYRPIEEMYVDGKPRPMGFRYLIHRAARGKSVEIWGDPTVAKDIVYVKDFTQLLIKGIRSDVQRGVYNVATGKATTLEEQIRGIVEVFTPPESPSDIVYRPEKPSQNSYLYSIDNARSDLDYEPRYSYMDMLIDMKSEIKSDRFDHLEQADVTI